MTQDEQQPGAAGGGGNPEQVRVQHLTARVPERISRGAFSTGVIVMTGGTEFILDFVQSIGHPAHIVARIIMPHAVMPQFIQALNKNLELYTQRFGAMAELPKSAAAARQPSAQELYDELKLPEDLLSGAYANGVMIGHTASEFRLDFITNLFPHSAVSARVFLAAPQMPRLLESLMRNWQQYQERLRQLPPAKPSDAPPEEGERGPDPEGPPGSEGPLG